MARQPKNNNVDVSKMKVGDRLVEVIPSGIAMATRNYYEILEIYPGMVMMKITESPQENNIGIKTCEALKFGKIPESRGLWFRA